MLNVDHIRRCYRRNSVLSDVSFTAVPGECIGLIGPNGCGKTTLLQILAGLLKPDSGSIRYNETDLLSGKNISSQIIGYVPQVNPLFDDMTVWDHLKLWYSRNTGKNHPSLSEDLKSGFPAQLGIDKYLEKKVCELSGGMKKRLSLACAMASDPPILLLDEPAASLDLPGKAEIRREIQDLKEKEKIILLATHEEAYFPICSRLLLLNKGIAREVSASEAVTELMAGPSAAQR